MKYTDREYDDKPNGHVQLRRRDSFLLSIEPLQDYFSRNHVNVSYLIEDLYNLPDGGDDSEEVAAQADDCNVHRDQS